MKNYDINMLIDKKWKLLSIKFANDIIIADSYLETFPKEINLSQLDGAAKQLSMFVNIE